MSYKPIRYRLASASSRLTLFLLFCMPVLALGANPDRYLSNYGLDFWDETDGLPQSRIRDLIQTKDGYLWIGTDGGLVRFDGAGFTTFNIQTGDLLDNEVRTLIEDNEGGLWIGTFGGGLTLLKNGRFTTFTTANGLPDDVIRQIDLDFEGNLWIATSRGASRYSKGIFTSFTRNEGLAHNLVLGISARSAQGIYALAGDRLHRFTDGKFIEINGMQEAAEGRLISLSSSSDGSLWFVCEGGVVKKLKNGNLTVIRVQTRLSIQSSKIYEDRQGTVWLGSPSGLLQLKDGSFDELLLRDAGSKLGTVYCMHADREGGLWLGSESHGLARLKKTRFSTLSVAEGLRDRSTRVVFEDSQGNTWIGTASGFASYNAGSTSWYGELHGSPIPLVTSIAEGRDGILWIAAGGDLLKLKDGTLARESAWNRATDIRTIYRDRQDRIWIATEADGLFRFENGTITHYRTQDGLPSNQIRGILQDRQGALWITTFGGGVCRFTDGKFTTFTMKDGLGADRVTAIYEDQQGTIWFGTRQGLSRFKDNGFFTYRATDGLLVDNVSSILEDGKGYFWFSCGIGIFRIGKADLDDFAAGRIKKIRSIAYGIKDGMRTTTFSAGYQPCAWRSKDGKLLFASLDGVVVVDPNALFSNELIPPVYITQVLINKQEQAPADHADVPPGAGEVEIHYTALSFGAPEKVRFKYRIEGHNQEWEDAGPRRSVHYASLAPGRYRFQVIACNNDGVWNESGASFSFYLQPHYYQTAWFYSLILVALAVLAFLFYKLWIMRLKTREKELKIGVDEAVAKVKVLSGMLPICANCKKIRDDQGYWKQIENYIQEHSDTEFTHGICPDCIKELYPQFAKKAP